MVAFIVIRRMRGKPLGTPSTTPGMKSPSDGRTGHIIGGIVAFTAYAGIVGFLLAPWTGPMMLIVGGFLALIFAIIAAAIGNAAERKGRSWVAFFWLSLLITPLLTALIVATLPAPTTATSVAARATTPTPAAAANDDALATLDRLAALRDKGAITADEFEAKKKELLDRL